ncbi:MAG TPA: hypothetical protein VKA04_05955, partial [Pseudodesulfovibrio sp.]|nr:hypothetical protein [Pseudodesulfovibrio sp.]
TQTGRSMNIDQTTSLNSTTDKQVFAIRGRSGSFLQSATATSLTLGASTSVQTVSWNTGDDVMLTWVGQGLSLGGLGASQFGFEGITNNTSGATASTFSQSDTGPASPTPPFAWPTANGDFGPAPTY